MGDAARDYEELQAEIARLRAQVSVTEDRYRYLTGTLDQGYCICEIVWSADGKPADYRFLEVNPVFERFTGIRAEDARSGQTARDLVPGLEEFWVETYGRVSLSGEPTRFMSGSEAMGRWFEVHAYRIGEAPRDPVGILFSDITEQRRDRNRAKEILESITDAFFALDRDWRFTYLNAQAHQVLAREPGELLGKVIWDEYPGALGTEFETTYRRTVQERIPLTFTAYYPDHRRWYEVHSYPSPDGITVYFRDVTERMRTEEALQEANDLLEAITQGSDDPIAAIDLDYRLTALNDAHRRDFTRVFGADIAVGMNLGDALDHLPEDREEALALWGRALQGERFETTIEFGDAERERPIFHFRFYPLLNAEGQIVGAGQIARDVTQRVQMEAERTRLLAALALEREKLKTLFELAPAFIAVLRGYELQFEYVNNAYYQLVGHRPLLGKPLFEAIPEAKGQGYEEILRGVLTTGESLTFSGRPATLQQVKDGVPFERFLDLSYQPIREVDGEITGVLVHGLDVTDQVQARRKVEELNVELEGLVAARTSEVRRERTFLEAVLEGVNDGIVACDAEGVLRLFNRATREFHGLPAEAISADQWPEHYDLFHPDGVTPLAPEDVPLFRALRDRSVENAEIVIAPKDGPARPVSCTGRSLYDAEGVKVGAMVVMQDITERKRLELRSAELATAVGELEGFTYSVSHDMRAPLRGIVGNSRILFEDYGPVLPPDARHKLERVSMAAAKMAQLVEDLLRYARLGRDHIRPEHVDMSDLAETVIATIDDPHAEIRDLIPPGTMVFTDPLLVRLALQNLIENACKYRKPDASARVEVGCEVVDDERRFFVRDTGIGFDMAYAHKLFLPFERLHRDSEYPGTGIGLANVRRCIERNGGRVWAEGEVGKGATFYFTLPG
ncbi:MAG: PAS domain-containing protein [Fimbriimonas sp.]